VNKQLTWSGSIPLDPVRSTGRAHGTTVNDLALAAVTGALRRYLHGRGVEVRRVGAAVPIIPGPREQVRLAGVPIAGFLAWVPCTGPIGVGLSICSYAGQLTPRASPPTPCSCPTRTNCCGPSRTRSPRSGN
jgi:hypothetical protein